MGSLLVLSCGSAMQARQDGNSPKGAPAGVTSPSEADYKIGPQDVLRIDVWKESEISRITPVRSDGRISLPLLNDVQAAGLTPTMLAGVIAGKLRKYVTNPQINIGVTEMNSRRIYVTGEVVKPGALEREELRVGTSHCLRQ
ncbi:MAG TPA: polysaccharide biosynthesis/export family protein [Candidatus Sulfotelmatobacter sp.]|nr:polysaccharide biosynthesis/export family protein [Candidatus Sulfotelmatobacter sp.]